MRLNTKYLVLLTWLNFFIVYELYTWSQDLNSAYLEVLSLLKMAVHLYVHIYMFKPALQWEQQVFIFMLQK